MTPQLPCKIVQTLIKCGEHGLIFLKMRLDDMVWTKNELVDIISTEIVKVHANIFKCRLEDIEIIYVKTFLS
uniref:Matrix protein 2-2 n=1 Tax=Avian metapneumovirus type C TaxID=227731 RepID=A0A077SG90_9MONO|nr:matrix protein 2-2 [Avian metapneumovirus type C]